MTDVYIVHGLKPDSYSDSDSEPLNDKSKWSNSFGFGSIV